MNASTILLVDDDEVLSQVLGRVLRRQGYNVVNANNVAQAEQMAEQHRPQLGLLDLCLPDGDGLDLARRLAQKTENLPLILLTAYPLRLREQPELAARFSRVLTKPVNLQELRDAIETALNDPKAAAVSAQAPLPDASAKPREESPMSAAAPALAMLKSSPEPRPSHGRFIGAALGLAAACVILGLVWHFDLYRAIPAFAGHEPDNRAAGENPVLKVKGNPDAIELSQEVVEQLKIHTEEVKPAQAHRPLELPGTLGIDTDKISHLRSRFAGEIIEIAPFQEQGADGRTVSRPLRIGDNVTKDALLAVVWSADFGQKKSDLVDALSQLTADEEYLKRYETLDKSGLVPVFSLLQQRRNTEQSRLAVKRAENSLRTAKMTDEEIAGLEKELRDVANKPLTAEDRSKLKDWAKVEVRALFSGTIVQKNNNPGDIIDTTTDLFMIANMRRLMVWANVREEDLPTVLEKKLPIPWTVRISNDPNGKPLPGEIVHVSPIIDPTQHTAFALGYVNNPDGRMRGAQFITATLALPAPEDTVTIPTSALVEDGITSVVFVQPDPEKRLYVMKRVAVAKRFSDVVQIRNNLKVDEAKPIDKGGQGLQTLKSGERVVVQNALGMKAALDDLQSKED